MTGTVEKGKGRHSRWFERLLAELGFQRIRSIEKDAHEQLKIGTKKADVARFYTEHKIPFKVVSLPFKDGGFEAVGTLFNLGGCAPLGCGTDDALIGVRVKVDAGGTVVGEPEVVSMYTNCV